MRGVNKKEVISYLLTTQIKKGVVNGAFYTGNLDDRYPFIYPRDSTRIAMALDSVGRKKAGAAFYKFAKNLQSKNGEFVQRYDYKAKKAVTRPKETDCTALVIIGICYHYRKTADKEFLNYLWPTLLKAYFYMKTMMHGNGLVYCKHAVHENPDLEDGYDIWTNSWVCRSLKELSYVARAKGENKKSEEFMQEYKALLYNMIDKFWNGKHFIKCIKRNGMIIDSPDISMITPAWAGIISLKDKKIISTVKYISSLWDEKIGGYQRFKKFKIVKDWHWYDGGSGSWVFFTIVMNRIHTALGQKRKAEECKKWIDEVYNQFKGLPEHISTLEEFQEWKKNEKKWNPWLKKAVLKAEINIREINGEKVVAWVNPLNWSYAEVLLN